MSWKECCQRSDSFSNTQISSIITSINNYWVIYSIKESWTTCFRTIIFEIVSYFICLDFKNLCKRVKWKYILNMKSSKNRQRKIIRCFVDVYLCMSPFCIYLHMRDIYIRHGSDSIEYRFPVNILLMWRMRNNMLWWNNEFEFFFSVLIERSKLFKMIWGNLSKDYYIWHSNREQKIHLSWMINSIF